MPEERTPPPMQTPAAVLRTLRAAPAARRSTKARAGASFPSPTARRMPGRAWRVSSSRSRAGAGVALPNVSRPNGQTPIENPAEELAEGPVGEAGFECPTFGTAVEHARLA